jgi:hypothetical protein
MRDHTSEIERESGQLLIRSIVALLFNFEVPLKKKKKKRKRKKMSDNKEWALCVFSFCLCGGAL